MPGSVPVQVTAQRRFTITAKLAAIVGVFVAIIAALLALVGTSLYINASVRAYVIGEGLWSKGQKDAVYYLGRYLRRGDETDFAKYTQAIAIPLGDHAARLELQKDDFDYAVAERGFLDGKNAPADVPYMIHLFRWFHDVSYLRRAIAIWTEADPYIEQLAQIADEARAGMAAGGATPELQASLLDRIERINARVTPLEHDFSATLGEGARDISALLERTLYFAAALLLAAGIWVAWRISRGLRDSILALREGTLRVARGDLVHPIAPLSGDELGDLALAFNAMAGQRKDVEGALEQEREFLKSVLESLSEGIVACDEHGVLTLFNRATREMHGLPEQQLSPHQWAEYYDLYLADGKTLMKTEDIPLFRAFRGETFRDVEMVIAPKHLPRRTLLCNGQPIVTASGRKLGAVVALHDVTERKRAEHDLEERAAELQRSNEELERFAYVASHDLQEPLRTVASYAQLLAKRFGTAAGPDASTFVGHIVDAVHRMRDLIEGLLAYSRVSQADQKPEPVGLDRLLDTALANLRGAIDASSATIHREPLPTLSVIPHLITQLWQNLIGNALKFRGADAPRVAIRAWREGGDWHFAVRDNGIGIEPQHAERIFVLFQRLHTHEAYPGSGLGLAICRKIVERHGGRIWVEPGDTGTEFRFTLTAA